MKFNKHALKDVSNWRSDDDAKCEEKTHSIQIQKFNSYKQDDNFFGHHGIYCICVIH